MDLILEAAACPPAAAMVDTWSAVEALKEIEYASGAEVTGGVHDPGAHKHRHTDARGGEGRKGRQLWGAGWRSEDGERVFRINLMETRLCGEVQDVRRLGRLRCPMGRRMAEGISDGEACCMYRMAA